MQGNLAGLEEYLNRATNPPAKDKSSDNSEELANVASISEPVCALSTKSSSENSARKLVSFLDSLIKHPGQLDKVIVERFSSFLVPGKFCPKFCP